MLVPMVYLVLRAAEADVETLTGIVFRTRNLALLINTLLLTVCVLALVTLIALPLAWLVVRSDLRHRKLLSIVSVLPLAVPGYVMAYALIGMSGYYGFANHFFGIRLPRPEGLIGAALALSLYTFPYLFLNLRSALLGLDPALEETARSLGYSRWAAFRRVILPHLVPALLSGWLIIGLYVLGDFGVVALMRYEVFSYAIFTQYAGAFDRIYAAWLSLMLLAVTLAFVLTEAALTRGRRHTRTGTGVRRRSVPVPLGRWRAAAWLFMGLVFAVSLGLPALVLTHWMMLAASSFDVMELLRAFWRTTAVAVPSALVAALLAVPVVYLVVRFPSRFSTVIERLIYLGYAIPPLTFALAMVFFALRSAPFLYQSLALLIFACSMTFLALTVGPLRTALLQIGPRPEEVARSLGDPPLRAFARAVLPLLRSPIVAGALLVFIMVVKELPITFLLAPAGYTTLAMTVFSRTSEGMMAQAAPYAASLVLFASLFVGLILRYESQT
ncbi:ABC transporter permease [Pseudochelatococcus sp. B33]